MADFYISELGAGDKLGGSLLNAKDHASVVDGDYTSVTPGTDIIYIVGYLTTNFHLPWQSQGTAGNVQLIDAQTHSGGSQVTGNGEQAVSFAWGNDYQKLLGGYWEENDAVGFGSAMQIGAGSTNIEVNGSEFVSLDDHECVKMWLADDVDTTDIVFDNCTFDVSVASKTAIRWNLYNDPLTSSGTYRNVMTRNCTSNGKFGVFAFAFQEDPRGESFYNEDRFLRDYFVENNIINDTQRVAIGVKFIIGGAVRGNVLTNCGIDDTYLLTNNIQTGYCRDFVIEDNIVDTPRNGSAAIGDGCGIILDWDDSLSFYSDGVTVRRNIVKDAQDGGGSAISNWAARNSLIESNLCTGSKRGVRLADGVRNQTFDVDAIAIGATTTITYSHDKPPEQPGGPKTVMDGDSVTFSGVTGITPDLNAGSPYTVTFVDLETFTIAVATTGTYGGSATCKVDSRAENNRVYCNTLDNNTKGLESSFGNLVGDVQGNIFSNNDYGIRVISNGPDASLPTTEKYNCFYNNATEDIDDDGTPVTIDDTSISGDPKFVDAASEDYNLQSTSPCIGVGPPKWWGNGPRPASLSGEPLPDTEIDMGAYQSSHSANHPKNLWWS